MRCRAESVAVVRLGTPVSRRAARPSCGSPRSAHPVAVVRRPLEQRQVVARRESAAGGSRGARSRRAHGTPHRRLVVRGRVRAGRCGRGARRGSPNGQRRSDVTGRDRTCSYDDTGYPGPGSRACASSKGLRRSSEALVPRARPSIGVARRHEAHVEAAPELKLWSELTAAPRSGPRCSRAASVEVREPSPPERACLSRSELASPWLRA